jgi:hypothetical protein
MKPHHLGESAKPNKDHFNSLNIQSSSSNPYNYAFILKVILFIILLILVAVLCVYSAKTSNRKMSNKLLFTDDGYG